MIKAWDPQTGGGRYTEFAAWLDGVLSGRQLPDEVAAVNFNIYDGADDTYEVEMIGAPSFDENDDDWACEELFTSDLLSLPVTPDTEDWEDGLSEIIGLVRAYMDAGRFRGLLEACEAVGVGHVNGAIEVVYRRPALFAAAAPALPLDVPGVDDALPLSQAIPPQPPPKAVLELFAEAEAEEETLAAPIQKGAPAPQAPAQPVQCYKLIREVRPKSISCKPKREYGIRQYELLRATPFPRWNLDFTFVYQAAKGDVATDLLSNSMGWLLVSTRLKALLEELEPRVEYFPVKVVEESTGKELAGYHVANLLRKQDALCLAESDYSVVEHPVFGAYNLVKKYALRSSGVGGADIFKLPDHQEIPVFVSARFKRAMEEKGITGMAYYPCKMV